MSRPDLLRYWPRQEDVVACVKTDAEAASEAVSLVVHQPMRLERRIIGGGDGGVLDLCDEHDLLRSFLAENLSEGRVIVPIVGSSGIGKSHVVRWLHAQIRRLPGADRRVVIPIPKGTSLKGVLAILLSKVQGPAYDQYRKELARAQEELEPQEAAGLLCEMLAHTLTEVGTEARARLVANPGDKREQENDAYCRADMLPALLRNQLLRDRHFVHTPDGNDGVVKRLVEQLTEGRAPGTDDDRQQLFRPDDLVFDQRIERDVLGRAEARALAQLDREDRRETAARILNAALDDAKQRLLRLDPTISDLFDAVRRELLEEGKELILLVEDFAVLSGLQKQLLQVIIKEAIRDGRQVLCTMRTALAYTTGYMDTATVLTRANVEYRIPDEPGNEEEMLARIKRLVGAYLNAARLGQEDIERAYRVRLTEAVELGDWAPLFSVGVEPEARATLDAFGKSADGYEFFPLNEAAVDELAREGSVQSGRLVYNPRWVIQNVINKALVHRDLFEQGKFPPATFGGHGRPLLARVIEDVRRRVPAGDLERYLRFLTYWGGCPTTLAEITHTEARVFSAFGFDKALFGSEAVKPGVTPKPKPSEEPPTPKRARPVDPTEAKWEEVLEQWRGGVTIPQADANQLRKWIAEALKGFVDWDWELFRPRRDGAFDAWFSWIYIPRASGNQGRGPDDAMAAICSDGELADEAGSARVQSALMAVVRFHGVHKSSWDYEGTEDDLPRYGAFVEALAYRARHFVRRRYFKAEWDPAPALVQGLLIGARALGIDGAGRDGDFPALLHALFAPGPDGGSEGGGTAPGPDNTNWNEFTETLRQCRRMGGREARDQPSWQGHLLNVVGARQGEADTVHAIDVLRLKPAIEATVSKWEFGATPPNPAGVVEFGPFRATYVELKRLSSAISKLQLRLFRWHSQLGTWLGDGADKEVIVRTFKDTIEAAKAAGLARGADAKGLLQLVEGFRNARVMAAFEDAGKLDEAAARGAVLTILGRGHQPVARLCEDLRDSLDEFLGVVEAELRSESVKYGDDPIAEAMSTLRAELLETTRLLRGLETHDAS